MKTLATVLVVSWIVFGWLFVKAINYMNSLEVRVVKAEDNASRYKSKAQETSDYAEIINNQNQRLLDELYNPKRKK